MICHLNVLKYDFGDIHSTMLHEVERPFESIFFILGIQKSNLNDVAEVMFLVGE
jgi:hypothetical protein